MIVVGISRLVVFGVQGEILRVGFCKSSVLYVCAYPYLYVNITAVT